MKNLIRKYKKFLQLVGYYLVSKGTPDSPFSKTTANIETFHQLAKRAEQKIYPQVDKYERKIGLGIDSDWLKKLAFKTQIVIKNSELCYAHGRVLYSALRKYLLDKDISKKQGLTIIETGTARGFSSVCMAKALSDSGSSGKILTFDLISNEKEMFWNSVDDLEGQKTRLELLKPWGDLVEKFIIFVEGDTRETLKSCSVSRVNFAFLDGAHTYDDVMYEFLQIKDKQIKGDIIVYDDYSPDLFPGIVKAVDYICESYDYSREDLVSEDNRTYVVAIKN